MANYSIFMLGESLMTISGGGQLDGVTQGDGSHMVGLTITLDSNAWTEVQIRDGGSDTNFRDNDGNQRLDGNQTIDGVGYSDGTRVEAEYGLTLTDGTDTWQVVGFNVNNSSPAYGTVEGLAFIGGPGGFPPVGVPLTVTAAQEGPNFDSLEYATPICYGRGTLIRTERGRSPIEQLAVGDLIWTRDNGPRPIKWLGHRPVVAAGRFAPVCIPPGLLAARQTLRVSQQHRVLIKDPLAELLFGMREVFVPAISLADAGLASISPDGCEEYHHLLLDEHGVIEANGLLSESLCLAGTGPSTEETRFFFGDLTQHMGLSRRLARPALSRREATYLLCHAERIDPIRSMRHIA